MQDIQGIANFLDDFMGGLQLIAYSLAVGTVLWALVVLRIPRGQSTPASAAGIAVRLMKIGAYSLAVTQFIEIAMKGIVIATTLGEFDFAAYAGTVQFIAGAVRILLAAALGWCAGRLEADPLNERRWLAVYAVTVPLIVGGAWLVHAVGRFDNREGLMLLTVLHQLAAAVWFAGVAQLVALWRMRGQDALLDVLWPQAITRFSGLGIITVLVLVASGGILTWEYVGSWDGLAGTGYGSLVMTKLSLLAVVLVMAWYNKRSGENWFSGKDKISITTITPHVIESEAFVLVSILFIAATLSSQPPAADISNLTATVGEVVHMLAPKIPSFHSPSHAELMAGEVGRVAIVDKVPSVAGAEWSNFNHNIAGLFLTVMGLVALTSYTRWGRLGRYWPLGFVGLGIFLFIRSDAETWPLGPIGFWESTFSNGEVLQHRMATFLALGLGLMEMKARVHEERHPRLPYLFPILCAFGGILLLTHAHSEFELKTEYLIQVTHTVMGLFAVLMATGRWLELHLKPPASNLVGSLAMLCMVAIGLCLMFYNEPIY